MLHRRFALGGIMKRQEIVLNISEKQIGNTIYIVKSVQSKNANETVVEKLKRIMNRHISEAINCRNTLQ